MHGVEVHALVHQRIDAALRVDHQPGAVEDGHVLFEGEVGVVRVQPAGVGGPGACDPLQGGQIGGGGALGLREPGGRHHGPVDAVQGRDDGPVAIAPDVCAVRQKDTVLRVTI